MNPIEIVQWDEKICDTISKNLDTALKKSVEELEMEDPAKAVFYAASIILQFIKSYTKPEEFNMFRRDVQYFKE